MQIDWCRGLLEALAHDRGQGAALNNAWSQSVIVGLCDVAGVARDGDSSPSIM